MKDGWVRDVKEKDLSKNGEEAWRNGIVKSWNSRKRRKIGVRGLQIFFNFGKNLQFCQIRQRHEKNVYIGRGKGPKIKKWISWKKANFSA